MASVKIVHYTQKVYKNGTSPIMIQVIQNRKYFRKTVGAVKPEQWDDEKKRVKVKKHPNWAQMNLNIAETFNQVEQLLLKANGIYLSDPFGVRGEVGEEVPLNFWQIADLYLEERRKQNGWTYLSFKSHIERFKAHVKKPDLFLEDIDQRMVRSYIAFRRSEGNADSTIRLGLKVLRFVSSYAYAQGHGAKPDALHNFKLPAAKNVPKEKLTLAELNAFAAVELKPGSKMEECRDIFILSVYLRGIRISDALMLKKADFKNGRLDYRSSKTGKHFDIKLVGPAAAIVQKYQDSPGRYLFSLYSNTANYDTGKDEHIVIKATYIKTLTAFVNKNLAIIADRAKIKKKVSSHIARHTFAKMAIDKISDTNITMDLLGHSNLKVHEAYVREISKADKLDDAADDIFG